MISHPVVLAILVIDLCSVLLLLGAATVATQVLTRWTPASASKAQLLLESRFETATLLTRWGTSCFAGATLLMLVGISSVLPAAIPGAMCGTGVLEAAGDLAPRALVLRAIALFALAAVHVVERVNRPYPLSPLVLPLAKAILVALPLVLLAITEGMRALTRIDASTPASCCALVYERAGAGLTSELATGSMAGMLAGASGCVVLGCGLLLTRRRAAHPRPVALLGAGAALVYVLAGTTALTRWLAPYHYGVLAHQCPWCLFLWEHRAVGFPLFASLAWTAYEGLSAVLAMELAARHPEVAQAAARRTRSAGARLVLSVAGFSILAVTPALHYRLTHGVWMHGAP